MELYSPDIKTKEFNVGMDIEWVTTETSKVIDPKPHAFVIKNYGNMGWDGVSGNSMIFEARPHYSANPITVVNNLERILRKKVELNPKFLDYTFHAGGCYRDKYLGAHLHYGLSKEDKNTIDYGDLTRVLDNYLGLASVLLENREQGLKRRKTGYGLVGPDDEPYRIKNYGAEYRVCSSFFVSPHVTAAFTCLFKVVVFEYLNNPGFYFKRVDFNNHFFKMDINGLRVFFPEMWADVQKMKLYPKFKCYIDLIYTLVSKKLGWTPRKLGIKEVWGFIRVRNNNVDYNTDYDTDYKFKSVPMSNIWGSKLDLKEDYNNWKKHIWDKEFN